MAPASSVEALLRSAHVTSAIDVPTLLSSEYDSDGGEGSLSQSLDQSGDYALSSGVPTPVSRGVQLAQKGAELSELERDQRRERRRDAETIRQLRDENAALRRAAAAAEAQGADDLRTFRESVEAATARSRSELSELGAKLNALQNDVPMLRQRLSASKADFGNLVIDDARYRSLRACADEDISVVEHVQVRVYELCGGSKGVERASSSAAANAVHAEHLAAEKSAREALSVRLTEVGARAEAKGKEADELRAECKQLRAQLREAASSPEGAARAALELAEQKLSAAAEAARDREVRAAELKAEAARSSKAAEEETTRAAYLAQDKEYLTLQVRSLEERLASSEARLAKEEMQAAEMGAELARAKESLVVSSRDAAEEYKQRLEREMLNWQVAAKAAQDAHAEAHASESSTLKDTRELALADADKWQTCAPAYTPGRPGLARSRSEAHAHAPRAHTPAARSRPRGGPARAARALCRRYVELKREHDVSSIAAAEAAGKAEAAQAELRAESRLKAFEAERFRMQCEQALVSSRQAQVDADAKGEKLEVLKAEYYVLRTSTATKIAALEASNASLSERIRVYEELEEELDRTVLQAGALAALDGGAEAGEAGGAGAGAVQPYLRVPSSAQRRMQQCLTLAKDLLTAQRRAEVAEAKVIEAKGEVERVQSVADELQRRIRQSGQPQSYLVEQVERADALRLEMQGRVDALTRQLAEQAESLSMARQQNAQLLSDLESLLSQRGSLDALRATLTRLLPHEFAPTLQPAA